MPPVLAALPAIIGVIATALGASAIVAALVTIAATVVVSLLFAAKKPKSNANQLNQGQELATKISPSIPRTVCVGESAVGPSCHFVYTSTNDSSKPNRFLYRVWQISDQPIDSLTGIFEGKQQLTFAGDITTGWFACDQHKSKDGTVRMWARVYKGVWSGAVADATLISETGGLWTANHKGTGISYAIIKMDFDPDAFSNGEPEFVFQIKGAHLYDDRADSTVTGGSGSQRLVDPTTWAYSDNTALVIAQYLRGFYTNGVRIVGVGAEARDLLPAMLFSAYNTADQPVTFSGGTQKRYACGLNIGADQAASDVLGDLMLAMDGQVFDRGGSITIWPGAVRSPVMNLGVQDIDWTAEKSWQPKASLETMVNFVSGNFVDKANFFSEKDIPPLKSATFEANDGGQRFSTFLSLKAVRDWAQAQRLAKRTFQAGRFGAIAAFVGGLWLMEMEQGDWCTLTVPRWNLVNHYFQVQEITLTQDLRVALVLTEESTTLDDWDHVVDEFARSDTFWNPPAYTLPIVNFSLIPYSTFSPVTGIQTFGFTIQLLSPSGLAGQFATGYEVAYALSNGAFGTLPTGTDADWTIAGTASLDNNFQLVGLQPGTAYTIRVRALDGAGRRGAWNPAIHTSSTTPVQNITAVKGDIFADDPTYIAADFAGVPKTGEMPKNIIMALRQNGIDVTSGISWAATRTQGNATFSITVVAGIATLSLTAPTDATLAPENLFKVSATYTGVVSTADIKVVKQNDQPPTSGGTGGGGGGTGGTTGSTAVLGNTTGTAYDTTNAVSGTIQAAAGTNGRVDLTAPLTFKRLATTVGVTGAIAKWQWRVIGGTFADVSTDIADTTDADKDTEGFIDAGGIDATDAKTGLTNGVTYEFRLLWHSVTVSGPVSNIYRTSGTMTATGS